MGGRARVLPIVAGGLALLFLAACSSTPAVVENRAPLPSCGEYENRNEPYSPAESRMNRCILAALARGRRAELVVTRATMEGDPYTEYVRVLGPERVEVFVDSLRDSEGGAERRWSRWLCRGLEEVAGYPERVGCREVPLDERTG